MSDKLIMLGSVLIITWCFQGTNDRRVNNFIRLCMTISTVFGFLIGVFV